MFNLGINKSALVAAAIIGVSVLAANVQASGYHSSSGNSGLQSPYNMGKQVFYKKVACDSCPKMKITIKQAINVYTVLNVKKLRF